MSEKQRKTIISYNFPIISYNLQATASAADPFNLDTRWLAGWVAALGPGQTV